MMKQIAFDLDGTLADFYGVDGWLDYLMASDTTPYEIAKPLFNFSALARQIHRLQKIGYEVRIISWLSKGGNAKYNAEVTRVKKEWLAKHLPSVVFDEVVIVEYGTPKYTLGKGILFDDEKPNRFAWNNANDENMAFDVDNILEVLRGLR